MEIHETPRSFHRKYYRKIEESINMHNKWRRLGPASAVMTRAVNVSLEITKRCRVRQRDGTRDRKAKEIILLSL